MQTKKQAYHHKDLRNALIETGIEMVHREGIQSFSLRKAANACGVSHAAPYSHFQNKEELLDAMQRHITRRFSDLLENTIKTHRQEPDLLAHMGIAYVAFFVENPSYFSFLFTQSNIKIDLTLSIPDEKNYKPYILYKNVVVSLLQQAGYPKEKQTDTVITIWAFIHGIASLATMEHVQYDNRWEEKVVDFMHAFPLPFQQNTVMAL